VDEFEGAGLAAVRRAVVRHGGTVFWAKEFELPLGRKNWILWTPDRIKERLGEFLLGRDRYPPPADFFETGRRSLYTAICRNGGHQLWSERIGMPRSKPGSS